MPNSFSSLGIASNFGLPHSACNQAAQSFYHYCQSQPPLLHWQALLNPQSSQSIIDFYRQVYQHTTSMLQRKETFVIIAGDHSCAMATWPAALDLYGRDQFGLVWIDAHLDAHNSQTSPSNNLHGMPIYSLLCHNDLILNGINPTEQRMRPENLVVIGARSFETPEIQFLNSQGVTIVTDDALKNSRDIFDPLDSALKQLEHCSYVGVSFDLDVIDPRVFPAVSTAEAHGLSEHSVLAILNHLKHKYTVCCWEFAELNPANDQQQKSMALLYRMIHHLLIA